MPKGKEGSEAKEAEDIKFLRDGQGLFEEKALEITRDIERLDEKVSKFSLWAGLGVALLGGAVGVVGIFFAIAGAAMGVVAAVAGGGTAALQIAWSSRKKRLRGRARGYQLLAENCERTASEVETRLLSGEVDNRR